MIQCYCTTQEPDRTGWRKGEVPVHYQKNNENGKTPKMVEWPARRIARRTSLAQVPEADGERKSTSNDIILCTEYEH